MFSRSGRPSHVTVGAFRARTPLRVQHHGPRHASRGFPVEGARQSVNRREHHVPNGHDPPQDGTCSRRERASVEHGLKNHLHSGVQLGLEVPPLSFSCTLAQSEGAASETRSADPQQRLRLRSLATGSGRIERRIDVEHPTAGVFTDGSVNPIYFASIGQHGA